jgi:predicted N-acetyltransferase YhbS
MCKASIRLEQPADYKAVEQLTFAAFETMELPGRAASGSVARRLTWLKKAAPHLLNPMKIF